MTIVEKVKTLLKKNKTMSIQDIYEAMPEHTKSSIRGNINRYLLATDADKREFDRTERGIYSVIEVLSVTENEDGTKSIDYMATYYTDTESATFIHRNFIANDNITIGNYQRIDEFESFEEMEEHIESLKGVLLHCNAIEMLKHIESESYDMVLTDPPYRVISGGGKKTKKTPSGMLAKNDGKIFNFNNVQFSDYIPELYRILKPGSHAYFFINFLNLQKLMEEVQKAGFKIHNLLVWEKNNATPNRWYMKNCEYVVFCRKGPAKMINEQGTKTVHKFDNIIGNKIHETEKPIDLLRMYIRNSSNEGDKILDPFAGSGSTLIASLLENRKCTTMEIDPIYIPRIMNRIRTVLAT